MTEVDEVCDLVRRLTGADLTPYKEGLVARRVRARARVLGLAGDADYLERLGEGGPAARAEAAALTGSVSVQVSAFFRDSAVFRHLEEEVVPALLREGEGEVRAWSAACAQGQEAYSLGVAFWRRRPRRPVAVLGTDVDEGALAAARAGVYGARALKGLPPEILAEAFEVASPRQWTVREEVRRLVRFERGDLLDLGSYPVGLDLIACRNLLIYLKREVQESLLGALAGALRPGGYLVLGQGETVVGRPWGFFEHVSPGDRIYRKPR